ncbi:MAG: DUF4258 domain-containing protein [Rubrobacter sp.]|nr:DUF4258 domain-containing protein [Rubrobacter sp.]
MRIIFLPHALDRMRQFGISEDEVRAVLDEPSEEGEANMVRSFSQKLVGNRLMRVVYNKSADEVVVITAMLRRRR